ncbi:MAG: hypothetical protein FWF13_03345 [Acidobacteria bacterium]|nr:hypothetical protein [Acidobacteriota bacterium]
MNSRKALLSAAILLLLFCAACGSKEQSRTAAPLSSEDASLKSLLPENNEVAGWTLGEEIRFFDADNLYEFINGAAENFLIYGFEKVVTADYDNAEQPSQIVVEIYQMADPRNTFGIYASERNPDSTFKTIGAEGYVGSTALNFWAGNYYVKLTVFQESESLQREMEKLAAVISRKIGNTGAQALPEIALFPTENQVPHSVRYLAQDVLAQRYFRDGFEAVYKIDNRESKLVIALPGDEDAAKEALGKYKEFTASYGKVAREVTSPGDGGFVGTDSYYGNLAAIRSGSRIFISLGEASTDKALTQAAACIK